MKYSEHFSDWEFRVSADHPLIAEKMKAPKEIIEAQKWASVHVLEPVREQVSKWCGQETPISITSGYRNGVLNSLVGGYKNSHHMTGHAVDITFDWIGDWADMAVALPDKIPALQYVLVYEERNFWHLGFPPIHPFNKFWQYK